MNPVIECSKCKEVIGKIVGKSIFFKNGNLLRGTDFTFVLQCNCGNSISIVAEAGEINYGQSDESGSGQNDGQPSTGQENGAGSGKGEESPSEEKGGSEEGGNGSQNGQPNSESTASTSNEGRKYTR